MLSSTARRLSKINDKIHTNVSNVQIKKIQCERLAARIDQLIDPLERLERASSSCLRQETRPLLDQFLQCIDDCNNYIEELTSPIQESEEVDEPGKFEEFNERLSQLEHDLSLGLNIQQLFDRKQDEENLTQILQQQKEQIDKLVDQRIESFLHKHLTQQDSILPEHERFLHIPYKDLSIDEEPIGTGGFADVYKGTWLTHGDEVSVKVLRIPKLSNDSSSEIRTDFYQEISIMHRIRYEHILTLLGVCAEPNFYAIILEYMPLGSLYDILHGENEIALSWSDRYSLSWQMAKSINYLHNLNPYILHRDIKSRNFLIKRNGSDYHRYLLKVCDFGLSETRRGSLLHSRSDQVVGSLAWKAPELLISHERHTKSSDVYSLGITMWELASAKKPWNQYEDDNEISALVQAGERPKIPLSVPGNYKQAIEDAWNHDPLIRPTCFALMERMCQEMKEEEQTIPYPQVVIPTTDEDSTKMSLPVMENERNFSDKFEHQQIDDESQLLPSEHRTPSTLDSSSNLARKRRSRRSIITEVITPSHSDKHQFNRRQSIIKPDDNSKIITTRF